MLPRAVLYPDLITLDYLVGPQTTDRVRNADPQVVENLHVTFDSSKM